MKKSLISTTSALFAIGFSLCGCGKQTETGPGKSAAEHPLAESPLVATCEPGIPGGRFVIGELGDPKTFNPITANETSSRDIYRLMFKKLLNFDYTSQE